MNKYNYKPFYNLQKVYDALKRNENLDFRQFYLPHSSVVVTQSLIKQKLGIDISLEELNQMMYEEGLLPAQEYGIPKWYINKWMLSGKQREWNNKKDLAKAI